MSCLVTSVFTFKIEISFTEWSTIFDSEEANRRHAEYDIKPLYRGVSQDDPKKVIVIHQHPAGNIQKFIEANEDWMASHKVDLSTMSQSSWTPTSSGSSCCD